MIAAEISRQTEKHTNYPFYYIIPAEGVHESRPIAPDVSPVTHRHLALHSKTVNYRRVKGFVLQPKQTSSLHPTFLGFLMPSTEASKAIHSP